MRKNLTVVQKCGRDRFGGLKALEWALQKIYWHIDKNLQD